MPFAGECLDQYKRILPHEMTNDSEALSIGMFQLDHK